MIAPAKSPMRLDVKCGQPEVWFVVGWKPFGGVDFEVDDEELDENCRGSRRHPSAGIQTRTEYVVRSPFATGTAGSCGSK